MKLIAEIAIYIPGVNEPFRTEVYQMVVDALQPASWIAKLDMPIIIDDDTAFLGFKYEPIVVERSKARWQILR